MMYSTVTMGTASQATPPCNARGYCWIWKSNVCQPNASASGSRLSTIFLPVYSLVCGRIRDVSRNMKYNLVIPSKALEFEINEKKYK